MSVLNKLKPFFLITVHEVQSSLYTCSNNDLHSPQILGDISGATVFNDIAGTNDDNNLVLCGRTSSTNIIGAGVEEQSCGGSISSEATVPFLVITGSEASMLGTSNVENLVAFSAMNLDDATEGQPLEY